MSNLISRHLEIFPEGLAYDFGSKFQISLNFVYGQMWPENDVCWCFRVKSKLFWQKKRRYQMWAATILNFFQRGYPMILGQNFERLQSVHIVKLDKEILFVDVLEWNQSYSSSILNFFQKQLVYDFVWKFQISSKFVYSQLGPRNHVCWCFGVKLNWSWRHMKMSNLISRHLEFFPEGLAYDFGSKFQISLNFVYGQMWPENDVCWCFRVKSKLFWQKKRRYQMWAATILNFFQRGYPMILGQNFERLQSVHIVKLDKEILFVDVLEWNQSHSSSIVNFFQKSQNFKVCI